MKLERNTKITRIDLQGVWEDITENFRYWFEYVVNDLYSQDKIDEDEYDKLHLIDNIDKMLDYVIDYADIYEFDFVAVENGETIIKANWLYDIEYNQITNENLDIVLAYAFDDNDYTYGSFDDLVKFVTNNKNIKIKKLYKVGGFYSKRFCLIYS